MAFNGVKVFIVEDSEFYRTYLGKILEGDESLTVCGQATTGSGAMQGIANTKPDVIILDLQLPDVDRFELLQALTDRFDIPIIVVSSLAEESIQALEQGASDFLPKALSASAEERHKFATMLKIKLKVLAGIRTRKVSTVIKNDEEELTEIAEGKPADRQNIFMTPGQGSSSIIAIGASLGGVEATLQLLKDLPPTLPGIVLVQHMPAGFTNAYAARLSKNTRFKVLEIGTTQLVEDGMVIVASGGRHLKVMKTARGFIAESSVGPQVNGFCPSVDVLFQSVARAAGDKAVGIILTGIGTDGALGLKAMHDMGAHTWGQDEKSCVVYGMPAAAQKLGAVDEETDLAGISAGIKVYFAKYKAQPKEE